MDFKLITLNYVLESNPHFKKKVANKLALLSLECSDMAQALDSEKSVDTFKYLNKSRSNSSEKIKKSIKKFLTDNKNGANAASIYDHVMGDTDTHIARHTIYWYLQNSKGIVKDGSIFKLKK